MISYVHFTQSSHNKQVRRHTLADTENAFKLAFFSGADRAPSRYRLYVVCSIFQVKFVLKMVVIVCSTLVIVCSTGRLNFVLQKNV